MAEFEWREVWECTLCGERYEPNADVDTILCPNDFAPLKVKKVATYE